MKSVLALLGVATVIGLAAPAQANPGSNDSDAAFLTSLRNAGITYNNPGQAIAAGKATCGLMDNGESGLQVISQLESHNPEFTLESAAQFAELAANAYCPQQLQPKSS